MCASSLARDGAGDGYARRMIYAVCCLAGSTALIEEAHSDEPHQEAIRRHDTSELFRWLVHTFSFQGIADEIADTYIERHGLPTASVA